MTLYSKLTIMLALMLCLVTSCNRQRQESVSMLRPIELKTQKLESNNVNTMVTADGYLWIGTSRGLYRWNGNTYRIYQNTDSYNPQNEMFA